MKRSVLRIVMLWLMFGGHILAGLILLICYLDGFTGPEFTTTLALILPLLGTHCTTAITWLISTESPDKKREKKDERMIGLNYSILTITSGAILVLCVSLLIYLRWFTSLIGSSEEFKLALGGTETFIGAYTGLLIRNLYAEKEAK